MRAPASGALLLARHLSPVAEEELVPSESRPGIWWTVRRRTDGSYECDCPDYLYRQRLAGGECKHIILVRKA